MVHQLAQHVDGHAGVSVALSIGVPQGVGHDERAIKGDRCGVGTDQLALDDRDPAAQFEGTGDAAGGEVADRLAGSQQRGGRAIPG